ncbi:MAG: hypothetical protein M0014_14995 [Actinomycetota bacterium]|jgi:hypothetical protein|nr:hypothetical protein [Actinomycetota bacterium]
MSPDATPPTSEADVISAALAALTERLPPGWTTDVQREVTLGRYRTDAVISIRAPGGQRAILYAEARRSVVTKDLPAMVEQAQAYIDADTTPGREGTPRPFVVARYLAQPLQQWLTERDIPYADAAGNLRVALSSPALFVRDVGAHRDPWRGPGRPKGNLTGGSAARVVRALVDFRPPYTVPALMKLAGTPSGNTYRAVDFIDEQALLTRENGKVTDVRWRALLERWSKDYSFAKVADESRYLAPRGLPDLMKRLARLAEGDEVGRYAVTGSLATPRWEAYAPAKNALIYADKPDELAAWADLRRVDAGANVIIARANETAAFDRTERLDGTVIVAPSQAAVDLLTAPGRGPEEGRVLLDWMEKNESAWRQ